MKTFSCSHIISILLLINLTGCASTSGFSERPVSPKEQLNMLQEKYFLPATNVLEQYADKSDQDKRAYRDEVVHGRLLTIDLQYGLFKEAIYKEGIVSNISLEILGVAMGGAGAAVSGATTSRILSALSGGISGSKTAINKNLYFERTMPALIAVMDAEREKLRAEIFEGLLQEHRAYTLGHALSDLERYLQAGSIPGAIKEVNKDAGETNQKAQEKFEIVREKQFVDTQAQKRIDELLDLVEELPQGASWDILKTPPSELDDFVKSSVKARLAGKDLSNAEDILGGTGNDEKAKQVLKMVLVLMDDRSPGNIKKWEAAMQSMKE